MIIILAIVFALGLEPITTFAVTAVAPSLGTASTFSVLGGGLLSADGSGATISGDLGATTKTGTWTHTGGIDFIAGAAAGALSDAVAAWTSMGSTGGTAWDPAVDISPAPGLYTRSGDATFTGTLTLNGSASDVWIFQINNSLTFTGTINLTGGAQPCNVYWRIASSATINSGGAGSKFVGTLIANSSVSTVGGVTVDGRLVANTGTLSTAGVTNISGPTCVPPVTTATLTLTKTVSGGTRTVADFPLTATGPTTITGISGAGSITNATVTAGTYTLSETTQSNYGAGTWSCTNGIVVNGSNQITLSSGNITNCTIVNTFIPPAPATLTLTKTVINIGGGTKTTNDFQAKIDGVNVTWITPQTLPVGLHTASEVLLANYTASIWGGDCAADGTITLVPGVNACTITNTYNPPLPSGGSGLFSSPVPPLLDIVKVPTPLALPAGPGSVTYTYTLKNIGTVPVTNITMIDDSCSPATLVSGDTNNDSKLDLTETWVYRCATTLSATHTNIATVTGWANGISTVDIANATVVVGVPIVPPLIHITKVPSPSVLLAGSGMVTYTEKITNPGTVALSNVKLNDDKCAPMKYISGDTNNNSKLETTETWIYTCQTRLTTTTTNTASVSGEANGLTARDFAIATVVVSVPGFPKTGFPPEENTFYIPLMGISSVPDPLALPKGPGNVTYHYAVKNFLPEEALANVQVVDNKCNPVKFTEGDDNKDGKLDYGETWRYACTTKLFATTENTAMATGTVNGLVATHKAYSTVIVGSDKPAPLVSIVNITKIAYPLSLPSGGGKITFTYRVNNPGLIPLSNVTVTDNKCSAMSNKLGDTNGNNLLDINEVWIYRCTTNLKQTTTNTVTATAYANGLKATGEATITVKVALPNFPDTGEISVFKITVWKIFSVILILLIIFFFFKKGKKNE